MGRRRGAIVVVALALVVSAAGCQSAKIGKRCRGTGFGRDGGMIVRCVSNRWRPVMTVAQYLEFIRRLQSSPPVSNLQSPAPPPPAPPWFIPPPPVPTTTVPPPPPAPVRTSFMAVNVVWADTAASRVEAAGIAREVELATGWYQSQAGKRPRFVRSGGAIDVRTAKLSLTRPQFEGLGFTNQVQAIRTAVGDPGEISVVAFVDGSDPSACGRAGTDVIIYTDNGSGCPSRPSAATAAFPFGNSYLIAHELAHVMGAVPSCAPNYKPGAHVRDDPRDLLYEGPLPRDWSNITLDPGNDDYFRTGRTDCEDIDRSPLW